MRGTDALLIRGAERQRHGRRGYPRYDRSDHDDRREDERDASRERTPAKRISDPRLEDHVRGGRNNEHPARGRRVQPLLLDEPCGRECYRVHIVRARDGGDHDEARAPQRVLRPRARDKNQAENQGEDKRGLQLRRVCLLWDRLLFPVLSLVDDQRNNNRSDEHGPDRPQGGPKQPRAGGADFDQNPRVHNA